MARWRDGKLERGERQSSLQLSLSSWPTHALRAAPLGPPVMRGSPESGRAVRIRAAVHRTLPRQGPPVEQATRVNLTSITEYCQPPWTLLDQGSPLQQPMKLSQQFHIPHQSHLSGQPPNPHLTPPPPLPPLPPPLAVFPPATAQPHHLTSQRNPQEETAQ
jgi:hypothetical protein